MQKKYIYENCVMSRKVKPSEIYLGDCLNILQEFQDNSVDLIITSPPYADRRIRTYGGIKPENYVEWFLPIAEQ